MLFLDRSAREETYQGAREERIGGARKDRRCKKGSEVQERIGGAIGGARKDRRCKTRKDRRCKRIIHIFVVDYNGSERTAVAVRFLIFPGAF
ncbi:hypothetical protein SUGI_0933120 [Cryptomeria japonica]|nr:hypothetical protein SUGI_0933120 [Cryptomeria japonica]